MAEWKGNIPFLNEKFRKIWASSISKSAAVRSSATVEDADTASFAGQFLTVLNVQTPDNALDALRQCWASMWTEHACQYRVSFTDDSVVPEMAVVVQEMVDPEYSGVAFTAEPVTGSSDVFYAEWVAGIGEALVSGERVDGRIWLDRSGPILRIDCLDDEGAIPAAALFEQLQYGLGWVGRAQICVWSVPAGACGLPPEAAALFLSLSAASLPFSVVPAPPVEAVDGLSRPGVAELGWVGLDGSGRRWLGRKGEREMGGAPPEPAPPPKRRNGQPFSEPSRRFGAL